MADSPDTPTPADAPAPTGMKARLPLVGAIIIGLAVGVGTGAAVVGPVAAKALGFGVPAASEPAAEHATDENGELVEGDSAASAGTAPAIHTLENLALNPAASGGARFLLLTLAMECTDAAGVTLLQSRDAELRDVVLSTLGRKTVDELADILARDSIKTDLVSALNERFGKKTVVRVYFPQYVVQ